MSDKDIIKIRDRIKNRRLEMNLTIEEVASKIGVSKPTVSRWETGDIANMKSDKIAKLADALLTTPAYLMGWEDDPKCENKTTNTNLLQYKNIKSIATKKIPMLGKIACGHPIYADEDFEYYVEVGADINADFVLTAVGDSMTGAKINDGDLIFCKSQSCVNNGEIAVVIIGDETTLKRVYYYPDKQKLILQAENPKYEPLVYVGEELQGIRIIGKAVALKLN